MVAAHSKPSVEPELFEVVTVEDATRGLFLLSQYTVADRQHAQSSRHETPPGVRGRAYDRLSPYVEAGVDQHRTSGPLAKSLDQTVIARIRLSVNRLDARGIVDVRYGWQYRPPLIQAFNPEQLFVRGKAQRLAHVRDQQHVGAVPIEFEVFRHMLAQHRGSERPETLAELDLQIEHALHLGRARIRQNRSRAQRPRTKFHASLKPADSLSACESFGGFPQQSVFGNGMEHSVHRTQQGLDFFLRVFGPQESPLHRVPLLRDFAVMVEMLMICRKRHTRGAAGIPRGRLNPDLPETSVAQYFAIGDAVERDTARHAQMAHAGTVRRAPRQPQNRLFSDRLNGRGDVHMELRELAFTAAHRLPEQVRKALVGHAAAGAIVEEGNVQAEAAIRLEIDEFVADDVAISWRAVGRQPHHLVFAGIHTEADVIRERRIQEPERMRESDLVENF